jgi:flagellar biosynthetic protein FliP
VTPTIAAPVAAPTATPSAASAPAASTPSAATPRTRPLFQGPPRQPPVARLAGPIPPARTQAKNAGAAPQLDLRLGNGSDGGLHLSGPVGTIVMLGLLAMLPTLVLLMTSFTRILIVLQLLRQALGTQSAPPGHLIAAFALLLTGFVMSPTIAEVNRTAISPWLDGRIEQTQMLETAVVPFRQFMLRQTREQDLATFVDMSGARVTSPDSVPLPVLVSAFATSELRTAFQIGFVLFLPFIIIDIVVAAVLMSMGMFMLPPAMISLPFKLLLFVLVDGWTLIVQSLVASFR